VTVVLVIVERDTSGSLLLLEGPLSVVRNNLANNSGTTTSTNTGTDSVSDPRLGSFSVLVDGSSSGSGSRNSLSVLVDGTGSGSGSRDGLDVLDRLSSVSLRDVGSGPRGGSSKVGVVGSNRGDSGRRSTKSLGILVVSVGSTAGGSLLLSDGSVLGLLLVGGHDGDLRTHVRSRYSVAHPRN